MGSVILSRRSILRGLIAAPIVVRAGLIMPVSIVGIAPYGWEIFSRDVYGTACEFNRANPLNIGDHHRGPSFFDGGVVFSCKPALRAPRKGEIVSVSIPDGQERYIDMNHLWEETTWIAEQKELVG